jgi:hypothetical protein
VAARALGAGSVTRRALLVLLLAISPAGPEDWPACQPELGIVTECYTPQGDWETIGRDLRDPAHPARPVPGRPAFTG